MGARFFSGPGRVPGFQLHSEAANRGGLTTFLAMPETDAATLDGVLSTLRDPSARADLDASLGRLAASLPPGSGFLVGSDDEVWVFPSPRIRFHRVLGEVDNRIRDPEVVRLKPRERVEIWGEGDEEFLGELYLELPPVGADEAAPQPADGPRIPRPIWRRPLVSFPVALAVAGAAAWFAIEWREGRTTARIDAYVSGNLEDRVVELVGRTSRDEVASPGTPPDGIANDGVDALEGAPAATPAAPAADVAAVTGWEFRASGAITSSPAFAEGRVVFGSRDSSLYCLDAATGERAWTAPVGSGVGSSPCVVDGTCYVGTYGGRLVACDLATGKIRWSQSTRGRIVSSPCVVGPNVIVGSYDRAVHALDRETGDKRWRFTTQGIVRASPEPVGFDRVVAGSVDGTIYCLEGGDGSLAWKHATKSAIVAAAAYDPGSDRVVVGSHDGTAWCLDADTGKVLWRVSLGAEINGQPSFTEHGVLVGTGTGTLHALSPEDGAIRWKRQAERGFDARPLVLGERVIVPSYDGIVWLLNASDGAVQERLELGSEVFSSPALGGQLVYVGTLGGTLHALPLP